MLAFDEYVPEEEGLREALCTVGNGYFATRGAAPEASADGLHYPGTYVAGLYNRAVTEVAGRDVVNEDLVNCPNWLHLRLRIDGGPWLSLDDVEVESFRQELDLRQGVLSRVVTFADGEGRRSTLSERRFVHMAHRHLAALETCLEPHGWSGRVEFESALDPRVENAGVPRYAELEATHLMPLEKGCDGEIVYTRVETTQSHVQVSMAARTRAFSTHGPMDVERETATADGFVAQVLSMDASDASPIRIEKVVAVFTSRDRAISESLEEARLHVWRARDFDHLLSFHVQSWEHMWRRFRLEIEGSPRASLVMNLHTFHLLQTVSMNSIDLDVGVPARGWHGEAYRGHVFWDELFIFPFINLHQPEITRGLLQYRYRRMTEARFASHEEGYAGAMFPWQSGSNGREETQVVHLNPESGEWVPDNSHRQRHISSAVAYNTWQYYQVTEDLEFLNFYGAEMILEIARFWASLATHDEVLDRYEIKGVMGPDEYHEGYPWDETPQGLDNNAYTNVMAVWVMMRALDVLELLPLYRRLELSERLQVTPEELDRWEDISLKMKVCFHDEGIISQFEGYERLEHFDWEGYREKYGDIHRLDRILGAEGDSPDRYQLAKQADVLMLFYLFSVEELTELLSRLGYDFEREQIGRNIEYYSARTSHGSTLSRVVHAWVLVRSDPERSWELFREALESDVTDVQGGTTREGIHLGAMAGSVDILQRGYAGLEMRENMLRLNPVLPSELDEIRLNIKYRGQWLDVEIRCEELVVRADAAEGKPIQISIREDVHEVVPGTELRFELGLCEDRTGREG